MRSSAEAERSETWRAALAAALFGLVWTLPWAFSPPEEAMGWDESMHVALPAARMLVAARAGEHDLAATVLLGCDQYPFVWPLAMALLQAATGLSELAARVAGRWCFAFALFGLFLLGRELARAQRAPGGLPGRNDDLVPWLAMGFGALSPVAFSFSGTLFLEVPSTAVAIFTLRAWLRRERLAGEPGARRRDLAAGLWLAAGVFTKFNYGLLVAAACALDWLAAGVATARRGGLPQHLRRGAWVAAIPVLALAWWFLLPLPEGAATAARHRAALFDFLAGNLDHPSTPWSRRALYWAGYFAPSPRFLALLLLAALLGLTGIARPGVRLLALAVLGLGLPVWMHPFQHERFLIPTGPALWGLAALGLARVLPARPRPRAVLLALLLAAALLFPGRDVSYLAGRLGLLHADPATRAMQEEALAQARRLDPFRPLPTAGLARREADEILRLVTAATRPNERVGWLGLSSQLSPAAIHLALLASGGSRRRFLADSTKEMDVDFRGVDPEWDDARFAEYASSFDVIFTTHPPDLRDRASRAFIGGYQRRLVEVLGWEAAALGTVSLERPLREPLEVRVYACRPKP